MPAKSGRHLLNVFVLTTLSRSFAILPFGKRIMASEELARHPWDFSPQENWVLYRSTTLVCQKDIAMPALAARVQFFHTSERFSFHSGTKIVFRSDSRMLRSSES